MVACCELVERLGGDIQGIAILIELAGLGGRKKLEKWPLHCVVRYE
jgi:adenine phosphoribosyltransferase